MVRIAIASGKGGTGKTFVATNLFYSLQKRKREAVLIDCDAEAPNAKAFFAVHAEKSEDVYQSEPRIDVNQCILCGDCHEWCNYKAVFFLPSFNIIQIIGDLCHSCGACSYACSFNAITETPVSLGRVNICTLSDQYYLIEAKMNIGVMSPVQVIKSALKNIDTSLDVVVIDCPPGTSCPFIQTVARADYVVLVTEPTPFGLSDLNQSVETLKVVGKPFGVIVNKSGIGNDEVYSYLEKEKIPLIRNIPFDLEMAELYSTGKIASAVKPSVEVEFNSILTEIMQQYGSGYNQR